MLVHEPSQTGAKRTHPEALPEVKNHYMDADFQVVAWGCLLTRRASKMAVFPASGCNRPKPIWTRVKNRYPKWHPSKWKHGPKPAVSWWINFGPYPFYPTKRTVACSMAMWESNARTCVTVQRRQMRRSAPAEVQNDLVSQAGASVHHVWFKVSP